MKPRLAIALILLVLAPVALLSWLGVRMAEDERVRVTRLFDEIIESRLGDIASGVERAGQDLERRLLAATEEFPAQPSTIREYVRTSRDFSHALVFDEEDRLVFPPYGGDKSAAETTFLERTRGLWESRAFARRALNVELNKAPAPGDPDGGVQQARSGRPDHGWYTWYWGGGLNLMFWRHLQDNRTVAIEVDRVRLLSLVVSVLPATGEIVGERTALLDASGDLIYQWGAGEQPFRIERTLAAPLTAWRLAWGGQMPTATARLGFSLLAALVAVGVMLAGLALYLYRESARELRLAAERVSFVNQVSHELKTPLTNIRMYAELLEEEIDDEDEKVGRYVRIMVGESQRLSRLIGNILTFARKQRDHLQLRLAEGVVDDVVNAVIEQFRPSLVACSVHPEFVAGAPATVRIDADALGQILGNLLTNVEKYAVSGGAVRIETVQDDDRVVLRVSDRGPGIPKAQQAKVFEPFHRVSNALTDAATGTGIGLGIARDLARLHGGDLTLRPAAVGATFEVTLRAERVL